MSTVKLAPVTLATSKLQPLLSLEESCSEQDEQASRKYWILHHSGPKNILVNPRNQQLIIADSQSEKSIMFDPGMSINEKIMEAETLLQSLYRVVKHVHFETCFQCS